MPAFLTQCPRCDTAVTPGLGSCRRCQGTFDPWVEPPPIVAELLKGPIEERLDFPTIARNLVEVNRLVDRRDTSTHDLAEAIIRDVALTTRLLRLVNGTFYRQFNGPIATVTRAVMMLGFEQVRRAALTLILYERLRDHPRGSSLANHAVVSFASGLLARAMMSGGPDADEHSGDEAFVCAMYHRLGEHVQDAFLPAHAARISVRVAEGQGLEAAQMLELGCTTEQLGGAVARVFGLPDAIILTLRSPPDGPIAPPVSRAARMALVASFSCEVMLAASTSETLIRDIAHRYGEALGVTELQVRALLVRIAAQIRRHAADLDIDPNESELVHNLLSWAGPIPEASTAVQRSDRRLERAEDDRRRALLAQGLDELKHAVAVAEPVHALLSLAVETLYRGFGFSNVLLCLRESDPAPGGQAMMAARIGFGARASELKRTFRFPISRGRDAFSKALFEGADVVVDDITSTAYRLPDWFSFEVGANGFVLFPIRVQGIAVGLIYGDSDEAEVCFKRNRFLYLREIRELIEASLERHRRTISAH